MKTMSAFLACLISAAISPVSALEIAPYSAQALMAKQQAGEPVSLHFHASWCSVCRTQEQVFNTFKGDPSVPGTLLVADYDQERELRRELGVRSQSMLIVFKGTEQKHRSGGVTDPKKLKGAFLSAQ